MLFRSVQGEIRATNEITAYYSDQRLKTDIVTIPDALNKIKQLSGVYYRANDLAATFGYTDTSRKIGVIAQELQKVLPELVVSAPFDTDKDGNSISGEHYLTVRYDKIVALLIEGVKELVKEVEEIKSKM